MNRRVVDGVVVASADAVRVLVSLLVVMTWACTESPPDAPNVCSAEEQQWGWVRERPAVDLLIVVDRSPSMADQADALRANLRAFANVLASVEGGLQDLHVAVVTSDLGGAGVPGCDERGDGGAFTDPAPCGVDGGFLRDDGRGARNYQGTFPEALACLGEPPLSTCPVSQPLAAIVAALDGRVGGNDGFRRSYAKLALIVLSDGDDCSLVQGDALVGVTGEEAIDYACHTLGAALADVDATLRHLRATLVVDPNDLILGTVTGGADARIGPGPRLEPVCEVDGVVGPAPRLRSATLPDRTTHVDMCAENWAEVLERLAIAPWGSGGNFTCFDDLIDRAPDVPGIQADCTGTLAVRVDGHVEPIAPLTWCAALEHVPGEPCLRLVRDELHCSGAANRVELAYEPRSLPAGTVFEVRCAAPCTRSDR